MARMPRLVTGVAERTCARAGGASTGAGASVRRGQQGPYAQAQAEHARACERAAGTRAAGTRHVMKHM
eukprot:15100144-Alexandrium_andersonii.AAC.1